ncbi:MAG: DUF2240 family protein [Candidatus Methanomethylophilaceae archaeon]
MTDGLTLCAAAFLRNKGKGVITEKEFLMGISMDLHWMPYRDAQRLLSALLKNGTFESNGEYIKANFETSEIDIPVAYRPPADLLNDLSVEKTAVPPAKEKDVLPALMAEAERSGMKKKEFIAASNMIQKKLNIDVAAAGLIVLRDRGIDISPFIETVYRNAAEE